MAMCAAPAQDEETYRAQIQSDFKVKDASFFTGTWGEQAKWPRLLVFCASDIPLTHEQYKKCAGMNKDGGATTMKSINVNLVVVDAVDEGFTKVPLFKDGNTFKNADGAKPMSKVVESERLPGSGLRDVRCWPWTMIRENPQAKGAIREDEGLGWKLQPGMVLRHRLWEDGMRGYPSKEKKPMSREMNIAGAEGMDVIPAFSMLVVEVAIKAWCPRVKGEEYVDAVSGQKRTREEKDLSPVMRQYGISVADAKVVGGTLYSCLGKIRQAIMPTHVHSLALQKDHIESNWSIANCLQSTQAPMYVQDLAADTFFLSDPENRIIKLTEWSSGLEEMPIDVRFEDVMRFTNCATVEQGMALIEFACQAGCLEMLCVHDKYRRRRTDENPVYSELYGVPLVNVPKLLSCVRADEFTTLRPYAADARFFEFDADYRVMNFGDDGQPDKLYQPKVLVSKEPVASEGGAGGAAAPGSPDMCLVGAGFAVEKGYLVRFVNTITGRVACSAYFNLSKPSMMSRSACGNVLGGAGSRLVRKRWASGQLTKDPEEIRDPFEASLPGKSAGAEAPPPPPKAGGAESPREEGETGDDEDEEEEEEEEASPPASQNKAAGRQQQRAQAAPPKRRKGPGSK